MSIRFVALCAVLLIGLLAACSDDAADPADGTGGVASGEVLEGSISDAMLPLDELRSQAPLEVSEEADGEPSGSSEMPDNSDGDDSQGDPADS